LSAETQHRNVQRAAKSIAEIVKTTPHSIVLSHGNGPQVGLLALQSYSYKDIPPFPLDILDAESQGMIGYLIEKQMMDELPTHKFATLITQVLVDSKDSALSFPTKPIGPWYSQEEMYNLKSVYPDWSFLKQVKKSATFYRRVVASPKPVAIRNIEVISLLVNHGVIVIAGGGGGVPVTATEGGGHRGVEAVVDKDLTAGKLAVDLGANGLIILTDVDAVYTNYETKIQKALRSISPEDLLKYDFPLGSMGPKAEACARFAAGGDGRWAAIGSLENAADIVRGKCGTRIEKGAPLRHWEPSTLK